MLSKAIIIEDISIFKSVSGVGPKTAKQIVLQLKDKMEKNYSSRSSSIKASSLKPSITTPEQESVLALESLGFSPMEARLKVEKILTKYPEIMVEDIVKRALSEKQ
jgi:Holliday junction DNA helicase RuvA